MATYYRRDENVVDAMSQGVSGIRVFLCNQPANTPGNLQIPSPLAQVYADPKGQVPLDQVSSGQQLCTDAYGFVSYYAAPGVYTVVYSSAQIDGFQMVLTDQVIAPPTPVYNWNDDASWNGTLTGAIDGANRVFQLSAAPNPITSLILSVNGLVQLGWGISGNTVTLAVAPRSGDGLTARYLYLQGS